MEASPSKLEEYWIVSLPAREDHLRSCYSGSTAAFIPQRNCSTLLSFAPNPQISDEPMHLTTGSYEIPPIFPMLFHVHLKLDASVTSAPSLTHI